MRTSAFMLASMACTCHGHSYLGRSQKEFKNSMSMFKTVLNQARSERQLGASNALAMLLTAFNNPIAGLHFGIGRVGKSSRLKPGILMQDKDTKERDYILVTGSGQGIGYAVCDALVKKSTSEQPINVIASGRTAAGSASAQAKLREGLPASVDAEVHALELDVADAASRARAVQKLREILGGGKLTALVNNAGIAADLPWSPAPSDVSYGDFTDRVLQTNFFGPLKLTESLIEEGLLTDGGRILFVSSGGGHIAINKVLPEIKERFLSPTLSTEDVMKEAHDFVTDAQQGGKDRLEQKWNYTHRYGFSKLCVSAASRTFAREHPGFIVHACTPGFVKTRMTVGASSANLTPDEGAAVIVHLLLSQDAMVLESGKFFNHELEVLTWDDGRYVSAK